MLPTECKTAHSRVLSGSAILLTGSGLATGINLIYNVAVAQFLGPAGFAHATAVYTLLVLISAVTLSFQILTAKVVAQQDSFQAKGAAYRTFHRQAWLAGVAVALLLIAFRNVISNYLNLPTPLLVILLAVGAAFYVPLGTRRGYIQGACSFQDLAINLVLEGFVRLIGSLALIGFGFGVAGVIAANAGAVAIAYLFALARVPIAVPSELHVNVAFREGLQAIVFFIGQVAINNCDIVVVKHFFAPASAGLYAAIALVGRVVFAFSWAVVSTMFPVAAEARNRASRQKGVLATASLLVFGIGAILTLGLRFAPYRLWAIIFGSRFGVTTDQHLPYLLALYAATTTVYALSVVFIAYEMSYKIANTGWVQLAVSAVVIAGMYRFHSSLQQVIEVQLVMMAFLLLVVAVPFFVSKLRLGKLRLGSAAGEQGLVVSGELKMLRRVQEEEVIAEFLKNDFQSPEFKDYQENLGGIVARPNLQEESENGLRRALLFIRHGALWRELPKPTEWYEVEVTGADLNKIRVFPRAHWRKLARGNFALTRVVQSLLADESREVAEETFLSKIQNLCDQIKNDTARGAVLLIGLNESGPFTVLDGNHRLVAAMLVSPEAVQKFRFYCGISPRMAECCWYETNVATLFRYGTNLLRHLVHDPETDLERLLENAEEQLPAA